ncbi:MAG: chromate transporter [Kiritimatiellia bacterium]|jgi:chromate transporter
MMADLLRLAVAFAKIGALTFGGGLAMLPLMCGELEAHGWMTQAEFLQLFGISEVTPGPIAVNAATAVGWRVAGLPGALVATLSLVAPSYLCIGTLLAVLRRMKRHDGGATEHAISFLRPIVTGLIVAATLKMSATALWPAGFSGLPGGRQLLVWTVTFALSLGKRPGPIASLCIGTLIGAILAPA